MEEYGDYNLQGLHQLGEIINLHELYSNMGMRNKGVKTPPRYLTPKPPPSRNLCTCLFFKLHLKIFCDLNENEVE